MHADTSNAPNLDESFDDLARRMRERANTANIGEAGTVTPFLDDLEDFRRIADEAMGGLAIPREEAERYRAAGHQMVEKVWMPFASGYVGKVTSGRWFRIVQAEVQTRINQHVNGRRSGRWQVGFWSFGTVYRRYVESRGRFVGDRGEMEENLVKSTHRHFCLYYVGIEVTGVAPYEYDVKDGEIMHGRNRDRDLTAVLQAVEAAKRGTPEGGPTPAPGMVQIPEAMMASLLDILQRTTQAQQQQAQPAPQAIVPAHQGVQAQVPLEPMRPIVPATPTHVGLDLSAAMAEQLPPDGPPGPPRGRVKGAKGQR